jgi:hypothetical protein
MASLKLRRFNPAFTFDFLILGTEAVKVSNLYNLRYQIVIFTMMTFFFFSVAGYLICLAIQSQVRAIVCGAYIGRCLAIYGHKSKAKL